MQYRFLLVVDDFVWLVDSFYVMYFVVWEVLKMNLLAHVLHDSSDVVSWICCLKQLHYGIDIHNF